MVEYLVALVFALMLAWGLGQVVAAAVLFYFLNKNPKTKPHDLRRRRR
jgi:O-antigen/teichoic acid export membrane protein